MSASSEAEEATPFATLTEWLAAAAQDEGPISLPNETLALFKSTTIHDDNGVRVLFKLFGSSDHTNRLRLDHGAFINVVAILLHLSYSHYQERLLFAFMTTIELLKDTKATQVILKGIRHVPSTAEVIEMRRHKTNNKLIPKMMQVLVLDQQEASMRTMAAHILFALVHESAEAQEVARKQPQTVKLGPLIDDDEDYVVRLFTANVIRSMCVSLSEAYEFWPQTSRKKKDKHEDFPLAREPDSAWVRAVADYMSNRDISRGFHGDSKPFVSRLLSLATGSQVFDDRPEADILSIVADRFLFVIPGSSTAPMALLEFLLDSHCECFIDELISPDFRPDVGGDALVHIETKGRGYQLIRGAKSAMDAAELIFSDFHQGEAFVDKTSQYLRALSPVLQKDAVSKSVASSSREKNYSLRRLDIGMIDISSDSGAEEDIVSRSGVDSIIDADSDFRSNKLRSSRSRQSSRTTEAKLKEVYRNKFSESALSSLILTQPGGIPAQRQSIDPRMLIIHGDNITRTDVNAGLDTKMDFATYVEQTNQHHQRPSQVEYPVEVEMDGVNTKPLSPGEPSAETRRTAIPLPHVDSHLRIREHRSASKNSAAEQLHSSNNRPPQQSPKPDRPTAEVLNEHGREHIKMPSAHSVYARRTSPEEAAGKLFAATGKKSDLQPGKPQILKRTLKSQPNTAHPMDWDVGDMADETTALLVTKKPKLRAAFAKPSGEESQPQAQVDRESKHLEDSGTGSVLKRPGVAKSHISPQKTSMMKHDAFEIEDDYDEGEANVPASKARKAAMKRVTKATAKKTESQVSRTMKAAPGKSALKRRKALQQVDTNIISLASTRTRRGQPTSTSFINHPLSDLDVEAPGHDEEVTGAPLETANDSIISKTTSAAKADTKKTRVFSLHLRQHAEASAEVIDNEQTGELHSDHNLSIDPREPDGEVANENSKVVPAHETLVTASPTRLDKTASQSLVGDSADAHDWSVGANRKTQHQWPDTNADGEEPDETAEDSYPIAAAKNEGPGVSFGSKLGKLVERKPQTRSTKVAAHESSLSSAEPFVGAVNKTSASPKKKPTQATAVDGSKTKASEKRRQGTHIPVTTTKSFKHHVTTPTLPRHQDANSSARTSDCEPNGRKAVLEPDATKSEKVEITVLLPQSKKASESSYSNPPRKARSSSIQSALELGSGTAESLRKENDAIAIHEFDQSNTTGQEIGSEIANATIDLTLDSDGPVPIGGDCDLNREMQDDHEDADEQPARRTHSPQAQKTTESSVIQEANAPASKHLTRASETKKYLTDKTAFSKTLNDTKAVTGGQSSRLNKPVEVDGKTSILTDNTAKKAQLVRFGKYGPQNQGIPSPDKQKHKSIATIHPPPKTQKQQPFTQRHSVPAIPNPTINTPKLRINSLDVTGVGSEDQGIPDEDDAVMEDAGNMSALDDDENAVSEVIDAEGPDMELGGIMNLQLRAEIWKMRQIFPNETVRHCRQVLLEKESNFRNACRQLADEASALFTHCQLPAETASSGSGSQSSRVDPNGSPRLQPQLLVDSDHLIGSVMDVSPAITVDFNELGEEVIATSTDESASPDSMSQDSDPSYNLGNGANMSHRCDRSVRTRTQTVPAVISSPKTVKQIGRKGPINAMKVKQEPRESLDLGKRLQEQYPQAQKEITTSGFKKPDLKTAVTKTLDVAPKISAVNRKTPVKASGAPRQPLGEMSSNCKRPSVTDEPSPMHNTHFSLAGPVRVTKPHSKSPLAPRLFSDTLRPTPASLKTTLLAQQSDKNVEREETIFESLQRNKSSRRDTEDADRTLVEGDMQHQDRRRRLSEASSVDSDSSQLVTEHGTSSRKDKKIWRKGSREGQASIRDALLEITDNVLFRLEGEEAAIKHKVQDFDHGCANILWQFRQRNTKLLQCAGGALLKKTAATSSALDMTFDGLQARKMNVRNADVKDRAQRAVKLRQNELGQTIEQILEKEQHPVGEKAEQT